MREEQPMRQGYPRRADERAGGDGDGRRSGADADPAHARHRADAAPPMPASAGRVSEQSKSASSASRRVRARLARRMTAQRSTVNPVLEPLVAVHREFYPKANLALLQRAYDVAEQKHADQLRQSGDPYITHPLAVANILAELGMDTTTLIAALLHDTVEDTGYTLEALTEEFGTEVGHLVDGVTKLDKVVLGTAAEGETIRKMIIAMARDRSRAGDQGRRPAAQHAHHALPAAGEAGPQGPRDAGSHCATGPSAGHGERQVGARGPVVRDPAPEEVRGDRPAGRRPGAVARHLSGQGARRDRRRA